MSSGGERLRDEREVNELKIRDYKEWRRTGKGKGKSEKKRIVLRRLKHCDAKEEERRVKSSSEMMLLFQGQVKYSQSYLFN